MLQQNLPTIDQLQHQSMQTATFAMGCFWSPESFWGAIDGVIRTRVGYTGGSTNDPTYRNLGNHIETVQLDFETGIVSYSDLLKQFFFRHSPTKEPYKRQYTSAIFYHSLEQEQQAKEALQTATEKKGQHILTDILPFTVFHLAEERHQKWKLRRVPELLQELQLHYPNFESFNNSAAVAKINGYLGGNGTTEWLMFNIGSLGLSYSSQNILLNQHQQLSSS